MNPAGIPCFYVANNKDLAIKEVKNEQEESKIKIAIVKNKCELKILDLTKKIEIINKLDYKKYEERCIAIFLEEFITSITKPIDKTKKGREINYLPSQVVVEWFKERLPIKGISYPSRQNKNEDFNYCFFNFSSENWDIEIINKEA